METENIDPTRLRYCVHCGTQIPWDATAGKRGRKAKFCKREHFFAYMESLRPICARPGCENHIKRGHDKYCSKECYDLVTLKPLKPCAVCGTTTKNLMYCSKQCYDSVVDFKAMNAKAVTVVRSHKQITGKGPNTLKRSNAIRQNNIKFPPKRHMRRVGKIYGFDAIYEPENELYRASIPSVAGMICREPTKKQCDVTLKKMMRKAGWDYQARKWKEFRG